MSKEEEKNLYYLGWILLGILLVFLIAVKFLPGRYPGFFWVPCVFRELTGYYCPGCGGTRACMALLKGQILKSFFCHPVVPYGAAVYGWYMISHTVEYLSRGKLKIGIRYREAYIKIAAGIIVVQWIVRNLLKWKMGIDVLNLVK